jgi:hypothetical protein
VSVGGSRTGAVSVGAESDMFESFCKLRSISVLLDRAEAECRK